MKRPPVSLATRSSSCSQDRTVRMWQIDGSECLVLRGHTDEVFATAFHPDEKRLATAGRDGAVWLWDPRAGRIRASRREFRLDRPADDLGTPAQQGHRGRTLLVLREEDFLRFAAEASPPAGKTNDEPQR